ncbi:hypothetical protein [Kribbella sp. NBC_00359]|uniref:hypothetical protein n=1 Tax=Kribbella sp. NBC_00359 TaxID=2975966 RepID=UPI002E1CE9EC
MAGGPDLLGTQAIQDAIDQAAHTLLLRGVVALVAAALTLTFAVFARNGSLVPRLIVVLALFWTAGINTLIVMDVAGSVTKVAGTVSAVVCLFAVVMALLPASGRYRKALNQRDD